MHLRDFWRSPLRHLLTARCLLRWPELHLNPGHAGLRSSDCQRRLVCTACRPSSRRPDSFSQQSAGLRSKPCHHGTSSRSSGSAGYLGGGTCTDIADCVSSSGLNRIILTNARKKLLTTEKLRKLDGHGRAFFVVRPCKTLKRRLGSCFQREIGENGRPNWTGARSGQSLRRNFSARVGLTCL